MLVLLFVALWFLLRGDLFYVLLCIILFLCCSILLALGLPRFVKRELILVLVVRLFDLRWFGCLFSLPGRAAVCDCGTPWTFLLPFFFFFFFFFFNSCILQKVVALQSERVFVYIKFGFCSYKTAV